MNALGSQNKRGVPGPKLYKTRELPEPFPQMDLPTKLESICGKVAQDDRDQRLRRNTVYYLMALYYQGYQNIELNPDTYTYDVYERDDFYIENQFRRHCDAVANSLFNNEGENVIRPASDNPLDIVKSQVAGPILDMQKDEMGYERMKAQKEIYRVLFGNAFVFVDYVRDESHGTVVVPKFRYEEVPDEAGGDPYLTKVPDGFNKINQGREVGAVCSPLEISTDVTVKTFSDVTYLRWTSMQQNSVLNYMYPKLGIEGGSNASEADLSQQYIETLGNLPGNILGDSVAYGRNPTQIARSEYSRVWLTPCKFEGDKELLRKFPKGVHVALVNGKVVDYYEDNLFDHWTHHVLIPVPHSLLGDGLYDALLMQDQINEGNSLIIQHIRYSTIGHNIFDSQMIDPKQITNDPANGWIEAKGSIDKSISDAVFQVRPQQLSGDVPNWLGTVKSSMQDMSSAYDSSVGKSLGANTPYSQSVFLNERAQSRWQLSRAYNMPQLVMMDKQLLKLARDEWTEPRTQAMKANTGSWSFTQFQASDLAGEIDITYSNTDMKPKGRAEQVQALQMYAEMIQLMPMLSPKQKIRVEEILGMPPDSNPVSVQISRAYRHIQRITEGETVSPLPMVDDPESQIPVFQEFLASQRGEDLALSDAEAFANVYTFMMSLFMMLQGQQGFAMPGKPGMQPPQAGAPPAGGPKGTPGGQPGQPGGGPQKSEGMEAQSPAPAPPVSPPSAA